MQGPAKTFVSLAKTDRVFIRLDAEAPARAHNDYAIRAHISRKLGVDPRKIPRVLQARSGWAVLTADITTRDLLVQRQTEWAPDLGAAAVETRQEWFTYLVSDYPRKLTDLYGNEADSDAAVEEEIEIQTGQKPVNIRPARHQPDNPLTKTLLILAPLQQPTSKAHQENRPAKAVQCMLGLPPVTYLPSTPPVQTLRQGRRPRLRGLYRPRAMRQLPRPAQRQLRRLPSTPEEDSERYDIVLLQEPWTTTANSRCLTKTHPAYDTYSPVETWNSNSTRPRVMTRDILWLTANDTIVVNFYRQNDERDALDTLL
ncbi:hypothetical protein LZL87_013874 [Fusarium oxysporum]|nr:hypothetical protein LZL87_013874 [Fusarium oxysporum]